VQLSGVKWGFGLSKGENTDRVPTGLVVQEGEENEEIWVWHSLEPNFFFKNLTGKTTPRRINLRINRVHI